MLSLKNFIRIFVLLPSICVLEGADYSELDKSVLAAASPALRRIPSMLNNDQERDDYPYSCVALVGKPGVGKTSLAFALSREAGRAPYLVSNSDLDSSRRNASSERFADMVMDIHRSREKTVMIFDEFNVLVENYTDPNHDTGNLSRTIWRFLDDLQRTKNKNIFGIATMNSIENIPKELKARFQSVTHEIGEIKDKDHRAAILLSNVRSPNIVLSVDIKKYLVKRITPPDDTYVNRFMEAFHFDDDDDKEFKTMNNPRALAMLGSSLKNFAFDERQERPVELTPELIDRGLADYKKCVKALSLDREVISESERHFRQQRFDSMVHTGLNTGVGITSIGVTVAAALGYFSPSK
jgi:DNA polymerase III delta prime subunit